VEKKRIAQRSTTFKDRGGEKKNITRKGVPARESKGKTRLEESSGLSPRVGGKAAQRSLIQKAQKNLVLRGKKKREAMGRRIETTLKRDQEKQLNPRKKSEGL